ncbi:hypothetical protein DV738_g4172, partial [Chaetothyriales sp. CBS 135597]
MGWLWGSSAAKTEGTSSPPTSSSAPVASADGLSPPPVAEPANKQRLSREEQANQEFQALLNELNEQAEVDREQRIQSKRSGELPNAVPIPDDISPDSLYPTTIHCRSAFDYAFFCQSFGGQFVNVYRYGSFRSCSNHWEDFWLCLRTRNWDEKDRAKAIREHYRKKAVKYKTGPSSEDVWEVRTEPVKDAFQDSLEDLEAKIEQWKKANPDLADPWKGNVTTVMQRAPS